MHQSEKYKNCLNCGYEFNGADNFCPQCGQENHSLKVPLKHIILELIEGTLHLDTKVFQTYYSLLFRPGFLTKEYNEGKRVRYVPPIRLYIFISFIFFFILNISSGHKENSEIKESRSANLNLKISNINSENIKDLSRVQLDSLLEVGRREGNWFSMMVVTQIVRMQKEGTKEFIHILLRNFSYLMFILMPFFAWLVFIFNRSANRKFYIEYLIYSIHFHSFVFLIFTIYYFLSMLVGYTFIIFFIIILIYAYKSLRNAFEQQKNKALLKTFVINGIYFFALAFFMTTTVLISLLMF